MGVTAATATEFESTTGSVLIAFSGTDCSGKSTQISLLHEFIEEQGGRVRYLWIRVGYTHNVCQLKELLRRLVGRHRLPAGASSHRDSFMSSAWKKRVWLYFSFADLLFETAIHVRYLRMRRFFVICDRYFADSEVDLRMNFGEWATRMWSWRVVGWMAAKPDIHIYLDLPYEEQLRRSIAKREPFPDSEERRRVRTRIYDATKMNMKWTILDAQRAMQDTAGAVLSLVQKVAG